MDYTKVDFTISPREPWTEILVDELAQIDFDSFTEEEKKLQAYTPTSLFNESKVKRTIESFADRDVQISYTIEEIPSQNWNEIWESDFQPVEVDRELIIYAPFHEIDIEKYKVSVEIQPQMSFGTGHHQTTYLLSKAMLDLDNRNKKVLDVGTGTGILGILASKLGASSIFGTDIEQGAYENALENIERNNIENFTVRLGDIDIVPNEQYDIIIANINKNVLMSHMKEYSLRAQPGSLLLLSGFFESDTEELENEAKKSNFIFDQVLTFETWAVMILKKQ